VALSTLSQLGLIIATVGMGFYEVAFFHILTHAFFKALLFISVGNIIHLSRDFQDLRKIGLSEKCFPVTLSFSLIAN
jgi:NADH:ubiquinone oxidoreductase subunit 5 (subunit L)/multisubunit Na+/H+ antiporter MnhA subunit